MEPDKYIFYDETISMCEIDDCLKLIPTKIIIQDNNVFYLKYCSAHGYQKTLISTDVEYYKKCRDITTSSNRPKNPLRAVNKGCPYDCGLCSEHEQHSAMAIVEIIEECNLGCPTCIANSHIGAGKAKSLQTVQAMFETLLKYDDNPDLVMISGGEPTIHPQFMKIMQLAYSMPFKRIMLITNGIKIAEDLELVERLSLLRDRLEIYLQFDSLRGNVLENIRGVDLRAIRVKSVENLEKHELHSALICVVKKSLNEFDMGNVIRFALQYEYIRGVTFQPCKITGRNLSFEKESNYITLSEVRSNILTTFEDVPSHEFIPHPLNPENISIAYFLKEANSLVPITNHLLYSHTSLKKPKSPFPYAHEFKRQMYFLPHLNHGAIKYEDLFRVSIVSFLDKYNFCIKSVKRSCIHFVTETGEIIPLDTYYLLYN